MKMSKEQLNYAEAKALYDTVKAKVDVEKQPNHQALDRGTVTVEQWAERDTEIEYKHNYWRVFDLWPTEVMNRWR